MQLFAAVFGFCVACALALMFTPLVKSLARRQRLEDQPGPHKIHQSALPHAGGLAIFGALAVALVAAFAAFPAARGHDVATAAGIVAAGAMVLVSGLIDDIQGTPPWKKLTTQVLAVGLLQLYVDVLGLSAVSSNGFTLATLLTLMVALPWFIGLTNAMNLIDGLDGLACAVAVFSSLGMVVLATFLGQGTLALLAAVLAGACLGFLRSNAHPAKIFMGDTGSMFLGFVLAALGARLFWTRPEFSTLAALVLITWVPCVDALYAVVRRSVQNTSIFRPDRGHIHHRLLDAGFSQRAAGTSLAGLSALGALAGVMVALGQPMTPWLGAMILATSPLAWLLRIRPAHPGSAKGVRAFEKGGLATRVVSQDRAA